MDVVKQVREFISYWYLRYLLATELYMVEPWERKFIHVLFVIFLGLLWYFNCTIIVNGISHLRNSVSNMQLLS